jgi:hypothetical protein
VSTVSRSPSKTRFTKKHLADLEARRSDLDAKKEELGTITAETEKEENELNRHRLIKLPATLKSVCLLLTTVCVKTLKTVWQ